MIFEIKYFRKGHKARSGLSFGSTIDINRERLDLKTVLAYKGNMNDKQYFMIDRIGDTYFKQNDDLISSVNSEELGSFGKNVSMLFYEKVVTKQSFYSKAKPIKILPRSERLLNIEVQENGTYICNGNILDNGLEIRDCLTEVNNKTGIISVINDSDREITLSDIKLELEPLEVHKLSKYL